MASSAVRVAAKRERARKAGLCITCCRRKPRKNRSVCRSCMQAAHERSKHRRVTLRVHKEMRELVEAHERAGDRANKHNLYEDAAEHYRQALGIQIATPDDRIRISRKLARALSFGENPTSGISLLEPHAFENTAIKTEETVKELLDLAYLQWLDARTQESLALTVRAARIADAARLSNLTDEISLRRAYYLQMLGRITDSQALLDSIEIAGITDPKASRIYYNLRGVFMALLGDADAAFAAFEQMVAVTEKESVGRIAFTWGIYGYWASALGNEKRAKMCLERALLLARRFGIQWYIPFVCLMSAEIFALAGDYGRAVRFLEEALSYDARAPELERLIVDVGIPIALSIGSEELLAKCARIPAIDFAFRSGVPESIACVSDAFAQWYAATGHPDKAEKLLHRALDSLRHTEKVPELWRVAVTAGRYGASSDFPAARDLLKLRSFFPSPEVAHACSALFEAFAASRQGNRLDTERYATEASIGFAEIGWQPYVDLANTLLRKKLHHSTLQKVEKRLSDEIASMLTPRQQDVAMLVLDGFTNAEIAGKLSISKYTVSSHIASIMARLGIRSRYQLLSTPTQTGENGHQLDIPH